MLISEKILKELARITYNRYLEGKMTDRIRPKLGNTVDLSLLQTEVIGTLAVSKAMGVVLYESGRRYTKYLAAEGLTIVRKMPDYNGFGKCETLEEARHAAEFLVLRNSCESTGTGFLTLTEYEKDKLIVFQVEECFSCYGITNIGKPICYYTGGTLAGFIESVLARNVGFVESKCYAKGDPCCEFRYRLSER